MALALAIAFFSGTFLFTTSLGIASNAMESGKYPSFYLWEAQFIVWLQLICIIAGIVVFLTFFIFLVSKKISYILTITKELKNYKAGVLTSEIQLIGNDELTELADSFNSFSIALSNHIKNEEEQKREKEELIKSLSHDIRTPLTSIISYSDFIKSKKYDSEEKLEAYISQIQNKAYQIDKLTKVMLNKDNCNDNTSHAHLDGKLMFTQFIEEFTAALNDEDFIVNLDILGLSHFNTNLNPQDISRIFDNLYSNIIKYADKEEPILLKIFIKNNEVVLNQTNTIKLQNNNKIESHGIGLKNISKIINSYGGEMNYSILNSTYSFKFKIPYNL